MASGISQSKDMAYVGEKPWHGLGSKLEAGAPIETWIAAAGMDWTIKGTPVRYAPVCDDPTVYTEVFPGQQVLFRSDTEYPLGIVSDGFKIVQPHEVLGFFLDLTEKAGFQLETAGCLFGGKRFWALAKTGDVAEIVPGDVVRDYLLLCTGADGSLSTTGKYVAERVVCNNTLTLALGEKSLTHKISHRSVFNASDMKTALHIDESREAFADTIMKGRRLADKFVSKQTAQGIALALLAPDNIKTLGHDEQVKTLNKVEESSGYKKIITLFEGEGRGATMDGVRDTAWGLLNAVTQYADHETRAKSDDHRMSRVIEGDADALKAKALKLCLAV